MPFGIHALDIGVVVAALGAVGRCIGLIGADGAAYQQPGCRTHTRTPASVSRSPYRSAKRGAHGSASDKAVIGRLVGGRSADLIMGKLPT